MKIIWSQVDPDQLRDPGNKNDTINYIQKRKDRLSIGDAPPLYADARRSERAIL